MSENHFTYSQITGLAALNARASFVHLEAVNAGTESSTVTCNLNHITTGALIASATESGRDSEAVRLAALTAALAAV